MAVTCAAFRIVVAMTGFSLLVALYLIILRILTRDTTPRHNDSDKKKALTNTEKWPDLDAAAVREAQRAARVRVRKARAVSMALSRPDLMGAAAQGQEVQGYDPYWEEDLYWAQQRAREEEEARYWQQLQQRREEEAVARYWEQRRREEEMYWQRQRQQQQQEGAVVEWPLTQRQQQQEGVMYPGQDDGMDGVQVSMQQGPESTRKGSSVGRSGT